MSRVKGSSKINSPSLQVATSRILSKNISMQDKIFMIKNYVSMRCVETVKKMNTITSRMSSIDSIEAAQTKEFQDLLEDIAEDLFENRMEPAHKTSYLTARVHHKMPQVKENLLLQEIDKYK